MERVQVPYAPLNNPFDLLSDPQLNSGKLMEVQTEAGPTIKTAGAPVASNNFMLSVRHQPPGLGQHTREVLLEIGYSEPEIEALAASGVVRLDGPVLLSGGRPSQAAAGPEGSLCPDSAISILLGVKGEVS